MKNLFFLILLFSSTAFAQHTIELKNASKYFDIKVDIAECGDHGCDGAAKFSFYKKNGKKPYQVIKVGNTYVSFGEDGKALVNATKLSEEQSVIDVGDYNFDGMEDIAICDGYDGTYGGLSYRVYLSNRAKGQFVYSRSFSELRQHLGMFTIDKKNKTLETLDRSGCCWHLTERYKVVGNRPVKVYELVEDATGFDEEKNMRIVITTEKTLVNGKWRKKVKIGRVKDEN